jgi:hypothetical protein
MESQGGPSHFGSDEVRLGDPDPFCSVTNPDKEDFCLQDNFFACVAGYRYSCLCQVQLLHDKE